MGDASPNILAGPRGCNASHHHAATNLMCQSSQCHIQLGAICLSVETA